MSAGMSTGHRVRLANWNVERPRPRGWKIPAAQRRRMAEVDADIWVLTETHLHHSPGDDHVHAVFSPAYPERRPEPERWTAIWSPWPIRPISDPPTNRRGTVSAIVDTPGGELIVYDTVIPWSHEPQMNDGSPADIWQAHLESIERQAGEWVRLRERFPDVPLVVAGDFNQTRDGSRRYGTAVARERLSAALERAGLVCITEMDMVADGMSARHLIDHVCVSPDLVVGSEVSCLGEVDDAGQRLSDHPTVIADLSIG